MRNTSALLIGATLFVCAGARTAVAQTPSTQSSARTSAPNATAFQVDVDAGKQWVDTKIDLRTGEKLKITATGTITYPADKKHPDGKTFGPDGLDRSFEDLIHEYAVTNGGHGELIGRLGSDDGAQPFAVGESLEYEAPIAGRLFLGINQSLRDAGGAKGNFQVNIEVVDPGLSTAAAAAIGGPPETPMPEITPAILAKIPRRISDQAGQSRRHGEHFYRWNAGPARTGLCARRLGESRSLGWRHRDDCA